MDIISAALVLFFVMDPLGNLPVFNSVLSRVAPQRRRIVLTRELFIALAFLVVFTFFGRALLNVLHLDQEAIRVGGGVVLFIIALRLVFPPERGGFADGLDGEPLVFPLAVPLIAGPSAFATVLFLVESDPARKFHWLAAVGIAWGVSAVILSMAPLLLRVIGTRGLLAIERLIGMLLVMISTQMILAGVRAFLS